MQHGNKLRVMTPLAFMARLAALIPPPRHPLIRFFGVFAPHSYFRPRVVPASAALDEPQREHARKQSVPAASCCDAAHAHDLNDARRAEPTPAEPHAPASVAGARAPAKAGAAARDEKTFTVTSKQPTRIDWATLLKRVYTVDALACPQCGGRMRFTALVQDKHAVRTELQRRGLLCEPPPLARARAPDWEGG
jgi:hypothetical protein